IPNLMLYLWFNETKYSYAHHHIPLEGRGKVRVIIEGFQGAEPLDYLVVKQDSIFLNCIFFQGFQGAKLPEYLVL
ncbi:MAG: hypothetical protein PHP36_03455, partial [Atribacterota bacterium]|nr:hypothetical protein [Atribacterota bacterium]